MFGQPLAEPWGSIDDLHLHRTISEDCGPGLKVDVSLENPAAARVELVGRLLQGHLVG